MIPSCLALHALLTVVILKGLTPKKKEKKKGLMCIYVLFMFHYSHKDWFC